MEASPSCTGRPHGPHRRWGWAAGAPSPPDRQTATSARARTGRRARRTLPGPSGETASGSRRRTGLASVLQVRRIEQLLLGALDLLARPHDLDQLLPAFRRADHDRADEPVVLEEQLAIELLLEAEGTHRL